MLAATKNRLPFMVSISIDNIIDAFIFHKPELKMKEIKDYVFEQRGQSFEGYKDRYSFDQTIQRIVEIHCPTKKGFNGKAVFQSISTGYYRLENFEYWNNLWNPKADDTIINLVATKQIIDLEITTRTLREVNIINRNKKLVAGLKKLHEDTCQICKTKLKISENSFYSEVHHIKPLGEPHNGPDTSSNMIVVCPNCHVLLDFKSMSISADILNLKDPHQIDKTYIDYHNARQD